LPRHRLDTSKLVNNYLAIVLYCIVVATCAMTFLQGMRTHPCVCVFTPGVLFRSTWLMLHVCVLCAQSAPLRT
jgi:hypothetical protein